MLNNFLKLAFTIATWLYCSLAFGNPTVLLAYNNSHFTVVHRIEAALFAQANPKIKIQHLIVDKISNASETKLPGNPDLIVTIGQDAFSKMLKTQNPIPVLSILTRQSAYERTLENHKAHWQATKRQITAIYPDQPITRHFALIKSLSPHFSKKTVGILLSEEAHYDQEALQKLGAQYNLKLSVLNVTQDENPVAVLDSLLNEVKIVLALPDNQLYNSHNARGMFLTAFHKRVPLIGYSRTFVNNGALAAIYTTNKQIASQTATKVVQILQKKGKGLPPPEYPIEFTLSINPQVANILKLSLSPDKEIIDAIVKLEDPNPLLPLKQKTNTLG
jgi:ABC-type uncharacterized transport system substrate-binding protein